ncbi:MAG: HDIG domain-containing protein [Myxococcota bacterium]|nr:HDIG domain-containing protein [Myxococcota bacterium]
MGDSENSSQTTTAPERPAINLPARPSNPGATPRAELAKHIPRRPRVSFVFGIVLALAFGMIVTTAVTAERWLSTLGVAEIANGQIAPITLRVAPFAGKETQESHIGGGGVVVERGAVANRDQADIAAALRASTPTGALPYAAFFVLAFVFAAIFAHHMRRSTKGRLLRVQIVTLVTVALLAIAVKIMMLTTSVSILVVPIAMLAMVPTMVLDRVVGLATGIFTALVTSLLIPFDVSVAIVLLVQAATAGLVVAEHPKSRWRAALTAGAVTTLFTVATVALLIYLTHGRMPTLDDPWSSPLVAAAIGPLIATLLTVPLLPIYQLLVGEITQGKLVELEDLSHPLLKQIAEKSPGTWQHSLMMANMAEIAANAIGASGRLVRVGAYYHDLGKSLQPKYFIENLEPGETSPHDQLPPEVSCDAIFAHVTEGLVAARRAGLHERIVDFMHMHHGNGVLEYFWGRCQEQGNQKGFTVDNFRYPGHPPQSRETAILTICDAVEAASRTLKKPDAKSIDALVQRIVYGKLHLGQLDESGLSMSDLRRISDSLRETIRHANHGRIEYPWQKAQQDASATQRPAEITGTQPRLDSLDRVPRVTAPRAVVSEPASGDSGDAIILDRPSQRSSRLSPKVESAEAHATTADFRKPDETDLAIIETAPAFVRPRAMTEPPPEGVKIEFRRRDTTSQPLLPRTRTESDRNLMRPRTESELTGMPRVDLPQDAPRSRMLGDSQRLARPRTESDGRVVSEASTTNSGGIADSQARKRAATLAPTPRNRAPTVQPAGIGPMAPGTNPLPGLPAMPPGASIGVSINARGEVEIPPVPEPSSDASGSLPTLSPAVDQPPERHSGPPQQVDLENAITNPPPLRRTMMPPVATRLPAFMIEDDMKLTAPRKPISAARAASILDDASRTEPAIPKIDLPLKAPASNPNIDLPDAGATLSGDPLRKAIGLASRAESVERDEWSAETPVVAPSKAELRALLGVPDVTRKQSIDEIDRLHLAAMNVDSDPEILPPPAILDSPSGGTRRPMPITAEVDPDDIESAIEVAPPARRTAIGISKPQPKKPPTK